MLFGVGCCDFCLLGVSLGPETPVCRLWIVSRDLPVEVLCVLSSVFSFSFCN